MRPLEQIIEEMSGLTIEIGLIAKDAVAHLGKAAQFGGTHLPAVLVSVNSPAYSWMEKAVELDKKLQAIGPKLEAIGEELEGGAV